MESSSSSWSEVMTVPDLMARAMATAPDTIALAMPELELSYLELESRVNELAAALLALGVDSGDRVGLLAPNSPEFLEAFFAAQMVGAVVVPLNVRYKSAELAHVIRDAELKVLMTTDRIDDYVVLADLVAEALGDLQSQGNAAALQLSDAPALTAVGMLRGTRRDLPLLSGEDLATMAGSVADQVVDESRMRVRIRDAAVILYTSGTTSHPKGCVLSHEAMTRGPAGRALGRFASGASTEAYWLPGPLFHIGALSPLMGCVAAAGTCVTDVYYDADRAINLMAKYSVTAAWPWFPPVTEALAAHPRLDAAQLPSLKFLGTIGSRSLLERLNRKLPGVELVKSSGMTEAAGSFGLSVEGEDLESRIVTQGPPIPGVEVRIVEPGTYTDLPPDTPGELLIRGFLVMEGYYNDEIRTSAVLDRERWLRTGDSYILTPDGRLVWDGRLKDMLKVGGENVSSLEVEDFLMEHPAVHAVEVVGQDDQRLEEVPVAFVELRAGEWIDPDELIDYCQGRLASYKVPRRVILMDRDNWPMSTTKVDKRALRRRLISSDNGP